MFTINHTAITNSAPQGPQPYLQFCRSVASWCPQNYAVQRPQASLRCVVRNFPSAKSRSRFPPLVLSLEFQSTCLAFRLPAIRTSNSPQNQSEKRWRKLSLKDIHLPTSSCLHVSQARNGHWVVDYTKADQCGYADTSYFSVCVMTYIIGKPEGLPWVKECLTLEPYIDTVLVENVIQVTLRHSCKRGASFFPASYS